MQAAPPSTDGLPGARLVRVVMLALGFGMAAGAVLLVWTPVLPHERERTSAAPRPTPVSRPATRPVETAVPAAPPPAAAPVAAPPPAGGAATAEPQPSPAATERRHTIRPGDTLLGIAEQYDSTVVAIRAANPGLSETALPVGAEIVIPPGR